MAAISPPMPPVRLASCSTITLLVFATDAGSRRDRAARASADRAPRPRRPSSASAVAASSAACTIAPKVMIVTIAAARGGRSPCRSARCSRPSGSVVLERRYRSLCSKKSTGSSSRIAALSSPFASYGVDGSTIFRPARVEEERLGVGGVKRPAADARAARARARPSARRRRSGTGSSPRRS